jgi:hypothetical protein
MGALVNNISNLGRLIDRGVFNPIGSKIGKFDPALGAVFKADISAQNAVAGKPANNRNYYGEGPIAPPTAPTQDTAANANLQQQDLLRRRRGVFANIFSGGAAPAPSTATKSNLGS